MIFREYSHCFLERRLALIEHLVKLDPVPLEAAQIFAFIVRGAVLPAAPEYAQPFESDHANGRPATFAFGDLLLIEQSSPLALADGTIGKLDHTLVIKYRTSVTELNDSLASTFLFDRSHPAETEQIVRGREVGADSPESRCQPRSQYWTAAWQILEQPGLGVLGKDLLNLQVVLLDGLVESTQLLDQPYHLQLQRLDQGRVLGQGRRLLHGLQALSDSVFRTAVMRVEESPQGASFDALELSQIGPAAQKVQGHRTAQVLCVHLQGRRIIAFESGAQTVSQTGTIIDESATGFHEQSQLSGGHILNGQRTQPIGMQTNQLAQQISIQRIVLGSADLKSSTVIAQAARINRINGQEVILHQRVEDRPAALFDSHRDAAFWVLLTQLQKPRIQRLRFMLHQVLSGRCPRSRAHHQAVLFVRQIQANPAHDRCRGFSRLRRFGRISLCPIVTHSSFGKASRKALDRRRPYRGPSRQRPLRIRFGPKRRAGSESLSRCILRQGPGNSSSQFCVTPLWEAKSQLFTSQKFCRAKVIHSRLRGENPELSSPSVNNFWSYYKGRVEGHRDPPRPSMFKLSAFPIPTLTVSPTGECFSALSIRLTNAC